MCVNMPITESRKQSDLEKRLKILRQQVYSGNIQKSEKLTNKPATHLQISSDLDFLYKDLLKILTLSSMAIGIQFVLFILLRNHILNLNFF